MQKSCRKSGDWKEILCIEKYVPCTKEVGKKEKDTDSGSKGGPAESSGSSSRSTPVSTRPKGKHNNHMLGKDFTELIVNF